MQQMERLQPPLMTAAMTCLLTATRRLCLPTPQQVLQATATLLLPLHLQRARAMASCQMERQCLLHLTLAQHKLQQRASTLLTQQHSQLTPSLKRPCTRTPLRTGMPLALLPQHQITPHGQSAS